MPFAERKSGIPHETETYAGQVPAVWQCSCITREFPVKLKPTQDKYQLCDNAAV